VTIEQLCPLLEGHTDFFVASIFRIIVRDQIGFSTGNEAAIAALVECLLEAEMIVEG
jgi:hypothetical protein